jgi:hypothetical protein
LHLKLIVEHYYDPLTFRPGVPPGRAKNLNDLRRSEKYREYMIDD